MVVYILIIKINRKNGELLESYSTLQKYCGEAGRLVSEHIDKPF